MRNEDSQLRPFRGTYHGGFVSERRALVSVFQSLSCVSDEVQFRWQIRNDRRRSPLVDLSSRFECQSMEPTESVLESKKENARSLVVRSTVQSCLLLSQIVLSGRFPSVRLSARRLFSRSKLDQLFQRTLSIVS